MTQIIYSLLYAIYRRNSLLGSPIRQKPQILKEFLNSLSKQNKDNIEISYIFIDDNSLEESSELLSRFSENFYNVSIYKHEEIDEQYISNEITHKWNEDLIWKVAEFKNLIIQEAVEGNYDYLFLIDSDLLLNPNTIEYLIQTDKDIISEIFWTKWLPDAPSLPQVWVSDKYTLFHKQRNEELNELNIHTRTSQFIEQLKTPGVYEVGGLGACTLITKSALLAGVHFGEIKNLSFWGEDRHFCIRAAALGFSLFVDTHYPAYHIYRESELEGAQHFKKYNGLY